MAFDLVERFPKVTKYYALLDPGQYQSIFDAKQKESAAPFLTKSPRVSQQGNKIWTHAAYKPKSDHHIPNCTSIRSKVPRFKYDTISKAELDAILCNCGQNTCECLPKKEEPESKTEEPIRPRIFIGGCPRAQSDSGISVPCRRDRGFQLFPNGRQKRILEDFKPGPPLYDTRVHEFTTFFRGCKWSHWTARRSTKIVDDGPGPAAYTIEHGPTETEMCAEKIRAERRRKSKQYRYIEMVQQKNLRENQPGPATYSPNPPKHTEMKFLGTKAERFQTSKYEVIPGPNAYTIKRMFDLPEPPEKNCHATLPPLAPFGFNAPRFQRTTQKAPGPADYETTRKICNILVCTKAPFGSFTKRFPKTEELDERAEVEDEVKDEEQQEKCINLSWMFKSKAKRLSRLEKNLCAPSPADVPMTMYDKKRSLPLQKSAPFYTSTERFQPWYNWVPIQNLFKTPGPAQYRLDKPSCTPAVVRGPLYRSKRFEYSISKTPASNNYSIGGGVETVLHTSSVRVKDNIKKRRRFRWKALKQKSKLSDKEKEALLLNNCIALLNVDPFSDKVSSSGKSYSTTPEKRNNKLLHCFLYRHAVPNYF
ncbi:PREDICTED: uncharacterized protein LOC106102638 [Papilio polytes]|uniref:uncharacterized protein LOC106102638 n=1 Tax=Papilio polytes TaxID=76194 RepID=UPI000675DDE1|nr:PREDICTED: uncharacterized protein LOC106102638 [Papilio polytes]